MTYTQHINVPFRQQHRRYLLSRSPFCHYCGIGLITWKDKTVPPPNAHYHVTDSIAFGYATVDHIIPIVCGGEDVEANLVLACSKCNKAKSDMPYLKFLKWREWTQR
jgi:5-methylcytosine-specific restriction endonuclease McrA